MGTFSSNGYIKSSASDIKADFTAFYQNNSIKYNKATANIQNNLIDTSIPQIMWLENQIGDLANGYALTTSNFIKEMIAANFGLDYRTAKNAQATIEFSGTAGTYIPAGTELNESFVTTESTIIGDSGKGYANAESTSNFTFAAGQINQIKTSGLDGVTATNPTATLQAIPAQTYSDMELQVMRRLRNAHIGATDYIKMKLLELEGTADKLINIYHHANGIAAVVGGGNSYDICKTLFDCVSSPNMFNAVQGDSKTDRIVSKVIKYGGDVNTYTMKYVLPKKIPVSALIKLSVNDNSINAGLIRQAVISKFTELVDGLYVGEKFHKNMLRSMIFEVFRSFGLSEKYIPTMDVTFTNKETGLEMTFGADDYLLGSNFDTYFEITGDASGGGANLIFQYVN